MTAILEFFFLQFLGNCATLVLPWGVSSVLAIAQWCLAHSARPRPPIRQTHPLLETVQYFFPRLLLSTYITEEEYKYKYAASTICVYIYAHIPRSRTFTEHAVDCYLLLAIQRLWMMFLYPRN